MRFTLKRFLSVLFILMLLPMAAFAEDTADETTEPVYVLDYFQDTNLDLTQYEGKALFLNFFTEWCPYCMEEMPDIKKIYEDYDPDSLEIILVHPWNGEDASNTANVVAAHGLEGMTTFEDADLAVQYTVGVPGYPTSIFIDSEGYLFYAVASGLNYATMSQIVEGMGVPLRSDVEAASETEETAGEEVPAN